jgi:Glycosyl transferase family 2
VSCATPVSVVIPAYDREHELPAALDSVARQSVRAAEVVVVDDGSSDRTGEVAAQHGARVVRHPANRGVSAARNSGVEAAGHDWIAFLDSDDVWLPGHLERLWGLRDGHVLVAAAGLWVRRPGREHHLWGVPGRRPRLMRDPASLVHDNVIPLSAAMVHRPAFSAVGGFNERLRHAEDLDLWLRLLEDGTALLSPDVGVVYRIHPGQATRDVASAHAGHRGMMLAYAGRSWWPRRAAARWETTAAWDDLRRAQSAGDRRGAIRAGRRLASRPQRLPLLGALFLRRLRLRRWGGRHDDRGRPVVALLPGAREPPPTDAILLVDLRDRRWGLWLLDLARRPPEAAACGGAVQQALARLLGVPPARRVGSSQPA